MIHKPKHPGQIFQNLCLKPLNLSVTEAAKALRVSRTALSKILNGHSGISPEMAVRISIVFKTSDEMWLNLQSAYDLWRAQQHKKQLHLKPLKINFKLAHADI